MSCVGPAEINSMRIGGRRKRQALKLLHERLGSTQRTFRRLQQHCLDLVAARRSCGDPIIDVRWRVLTLQNTHYPIKLNS